MADRSDTRPSEADFKAAEQEEAQRLAAVATEPEPEQPTFKVLLLWSQGNESNDLLAVCASVEAAKRKAEEHMLEVRGSSDWDGAPWFDRPINVDGFVKPGAVMHFVQEWELQF